ncbi:DUF2188 domain-containing protein [Amycolatopsis sp. NPDC052450]|uniref:DUF2188 domain-containing protein n=1 Tax=Amycolatopsis sp. NPDC052450 TaxID=3363937 RepID=UPI0037CBF05B
MKAEATEKGRDMARERKVEHFIRNQDGQIGERNTCGHAPATSPAEHPKPRALFKHPRGWHSWHRVLFREQQRSGPAGLPCVRRDTGNFPRTSPVRIRVSAGAPYSSGADLRFAERGSGGHTPAA